MRIKQGREHGDHNKVTEHGGLTRLRSMGTTVNKVKGPRDHLSEKWHSQKNLYVVVKTGFKNQFILTGWVSTKRVGDKSVGGGGGEGGIQKSAK